MYSNKYDAIDKMDTFLERQTLSKVTQKELESVDRLLTSKKNKLEIKNFPHAKSVGPTDSLNSTKWNHYNYYQPPNWLFENVFNNNCMYLRSTT